MLSLEFTLTATSGELDVVPWVVLCESLGLLCAGGDSLASEERHISSKLSAAFPRLVSKAACCLAHDLYAVKHLLHIFGGLSASFPSSIGPMTEVSYILFSIRDFHRSATSLAPGLARDRLSLAFGRLPPHPRQNILLQPRGFVYIPLCNTT